MAPKVECHSILCIWLFFLTSSQNVWVFFKHLYWSIIALQWCVSFCFITKWISYTYIYISPYLLPLASASHPPYPTPLGGHKAPSWSPCAMWLLPTSYLFYTKCVVFFFLFIYFIYFYFWLRWVFVASCRLSLVATSGGYSLLQCAGFSLRWLLLLWSTGSKRAGFSSCGSQALERRLSSCGART